MSEIRRMNLEQTSWRRVLSASLLISILLAGCVKERRVASAQDSLIPEGGQEESAVGFSEYLRTVFKLSQQGPAEAPSKADQLHQAKPALAALAEQVAAEPTNLAARQSLAAAYMEEGLLTEAYRLLEEVRAVGVKDVRVETSLARIWDEWGNYALADKHVRSALELDAQSAEVWTLLGRVEMHRRHFEAAADAFVAAIERGDGGNTYLLANLGYAYFELGRWQQARPLLEEALRLDNSLVEVHNNLGIVLAHLGEAEAALRHFRAVAEDKVAYNNLGVVQMANGDWESAYGAFQQAVRLDPDYGKAAFNLAEAESYLPAPVVVAVGSFGTRGAVAVATLEATPREASARQLAGLPTSGPVELPAWPRQIKFFERPVILLAQSDLDPVQPATVASLSGLRLVDLPVPSLSPRWLRGAFDVSPRPVAPIFAMPSQVASADSALAAPVAVVTKPEAVTRQLAEIAADVPAPLPMGSSVLDFGFVMPLQVQVARIEPEVEVVPAAAEKDVAVASAARLVEPVSRPTPAPAAADTQVGDESDDAVAVAGHSGSSGTPTAAPVAAIEAEVELTAAGEAEEAPVAEHSLDNAAASSSAVSLPAIESGSTAQRLLVLLVIVGLGVTAGSLTAGRFWGLVGGLVGAIAAALTALIRG